MKYLFKNCKKFGVNEKRCGRQGGNVWAPGKDVGDGKRVRVSGKWCGRREKGVGAGKRVCVSGKKSVGRQEKGCITPSYHPTCQPTCHPI